MVRKFRKKPVVIEAVQFTGDNLPEIIRFIGVDEFYGTLVIARGGMLVRTVRIDTSEGTVLADPQDWIIKGTKGEFYPCKPDIFAEIYEEVKE